MLRPAQAPSLYIFALLVSGAATIDVLMPGPVCGNQDVHATPNVGALAHKDMSIRACAPSLALAARDFREP